MRKNLKVNNVQQRPMHHVISLGAGVQSTTILWMAEFGLLKPTPVAAVFADTGDEPREVYRHLRDLERRIKQIPIIRVSAGRLSDAVKTVYRSKNGVNYTRRLLPWYTRQPDGTIGKAGTRGCTIEFKIAPCYKEFRRIGGVKYGQQWPSVTSWVGISTDEASRMRDSQHPWLLHRYPLIDLTMDRKECLHWMKYYRLPTPPRSACGFCPYHSNDEWKRLKAQEPKTFNDAVMLEREIQKAALASDTQTATPFLHKSCIPLDQVDFESTGAKMIQTNDFNNECIGMCGV